ncbi:hypothetical protein DCAR_0209727 [Daucus carota subsp. sativus]|uniref:Uncharacterized protein n=1 Tax=Daucus carota subsp. sativus TaxID=79200 RepID=A0A166FH08_DAUCS|nr:hypothetical protein DCAR_0209727 [Daucus carota subsp. sativus]
MIIQNMAGFCAPALKSDKSRAHVKLYSNSDHQIDGFYPPITYSRLRDLVNRIRGFSAFRESLGHRY